MAEIVNMPRLGLNDTSNMIGEWLVKEGDRVKKGDELFTIETDKSSMSVYAEVSGTVLKRLYDEYEAVEVLKPVCVVGGEGENIDAILKSLIPPDDAEPEIKETVSTEKSTPDFTAAEVKKDLPKGDAFLSPRAKELAEKNGVSTSGIQPSGAEGRILEEDVLGRMRSGDAVVKEAFRVVKLSGIRSVIAKNMMHSLQNTAQLTSHTVFNASAILDYREKLKNTGGAEQNITIGDMILFAVARTLKDFGYMNAHMVSESEMVLFEDVHLGCAVDTERGLMVPTIFRAHALSLPEISGQVKELAGACREGNIPPDKLAGGTFTVTNLGTLGVREFTPILNPPQVGILGVGAIDYMMKKTPQGMLYYPAGHLSLTYDHRAVDGVPSARFLRTICEKLENFKSLLDEEVGR
jgi:pyruvate dehydrogenase E2 component (dihydrolipoamide acetyltransferase)